MGAKLGFFLVELGQGFFDETAVELVRGAVSSLVVARAVPVRKEGKVRFWAMARYYSRMYGWAGSRYDVTSAAPHETFPLKASCLLADGERQREVESIAHDGDGREIGV